MSRSFRRRSNVLAWYGKTKPNTTKVHIHQSKEMYYNTKSLYIKRGKVSVRMYVKYVRNAGHGQLSSKWRHNEDDIIMRMGAASDVGARRANDVIMTTAGLWRYGNWRHVATGFNALVNTKKLKPGLVASYDIRFGNGEGHFWFWRFINLSLTYLLRHLPTYLQYWDPHKSRGPHILESRKWKWKEVKGF